ncbi:MAG: GNAT family N-acyltransferase [Albidovulum sp.]|uniref:GNAT family N-acetyltransferase n=1 Tax=Albidovulum sp. TaxID=1872424 RepID=UPI003CB2EBC2
MVPLLRGRFRARLADGDDDIRRAQKLRWQAFRAGQGDGSDADRFDPLCRHVLIEEDVGRRLVATFRLMTFPDGAGIERGYAAQFYDLSPLAAYPGAMAEMGRFCLAPDCRELDVLRIAWAAVTRFVDMHGIGMVFGCASFPGMDAGAYTDTFAMLSDRYLAPLEWRPGAKGVETVGLSACGPSYDALVASRAMPSLLRSYLAMGGWVGDHVVIDRDLQTLHVFTGLETERVPGGRTNALRRLAG